MALARIATTSVLIAVLIVVSSASSGSAYDLPDDCFRTRADVHFSGWPGLDYPNDLHAHTLGSAGWWEWPLNRAGTGPAIDVRAGSGGSTGSEDVLFTWTWFTNNGWGHGLCDANGILPGSSGEVSINRRREAEFRSHGTYFASVIAHEFGHTLGFGHSGRYDSFHGDMPVMYPCRGTSTSPAVVRLSQDDYAAAQALSSRSSAKWFKLTPNHSFENGADFWTLNNTTLWSRSPGANGTAHYLQMSSNGTSSRIYTKARVLDLQGHQLRATLARVTHREIWSSHTGFVTPVLRIGGANYPHGETCGYPDVHGAHGGEVRIQSSPSTSWTWWLETSCTNSTTWKDCIVVGPDPNGSDAWDVMMYVYNRTRNSSGAYTSVYIDLASVDGRLD